MGKVTNTVLATSLAFSALIAPSTLAFAETQDTTQQQATQTQATEQSQEQSPKLKTLSTEDSKDSTTTSTSEESSTPDTKTNSATKDDSKAKDVSKSTTKESTKATDATKAKEALKAKTKPEAKLKTKSASPDTNDYLSDLDAQAADASKIVEKDGFDVQVGYETANGDTLHVPSFTLSLMSMDLKTTYDKVHVTRANYDSSVNGYKIHFSPKSYQYGDQFRIKFTTEDKTIKRFEYFIEHENGDQFTETHTLPNGATTPFTVDYRVIMTGKERYGIALYPSKTQPISAGLVASTKQMGITFVTNGKPMKNFNFKIGNSSFKTDKEGIYWMDSKEASKGYTLKLSKGYIFDGKNTTTFKSKGYSNLSPELNVQTYNIHKGVEKVEHEKYASTESSTNLGTLNLKMTTTESTKLSDNWTQGVLTLTPKDSKAKKATKSKSQDYTIARTINSLEGVPDGTYSVSAKGDYATYSLAQSTVTIKNNKGSLAIKAKPKYTLNVNKDGQEYAFNVINKSDIAKEDFKGKDTKTFGVVPGDSYMVQDKADSQVYTAPIDEKSRVTTLVLGKGVVYGGSVTIPHTGDSIIYLIGFLLVALLGLGLSIYYYYRKNNKNGGNGGNNQPPNKPHNPTGGKFLKSSLIGVLILSMVSPFIPTSRDVAHAQSTGGTGGGGVKFSKASKGVINTDKTISVLSAGIIDGNDPEDKKNKLNEYSTQKDLTADFKFSNSKQAYYFYMPLNKKAKSAIWNDAASVATYTSKGSVNTFLGRNNTLKLSNAVSDDDTNNYVKGNKKTRIMPLPDDIINKNGSIPSEYRDNAFVNLMAYSAYYLSSSPNTRQLWKGESSTSNFNFGSAMNNDFKDFVKGNLPKLSKNAKKIVNKFYDDTNETIDNKAVYDDFLELLRKTGNGEQASSMDEKLSNLSEKEQEKGRYAIFYQVMNSFTRLGQDQNKRMFMSMHDASQWYVDKMKKVYPNTYNPVNRSYEEDIIAAGNSSPGTVASHPAAQQYPTYNFAYNTRNTTKKAIKPYSKEVDKDNPFTGWGYQNLKNLAVAGSPKLIVKQVFEVETIDEDGKKTTKKYGPWDVEGYGGAGVSLSELGPKTVIRGSMNVLKGNKFFTVESSDTSKITLTTKDYYTSNKKRISLLRPDPLSPTGTSQSSIEVPNVTNDASGASWKILYNAGTPKYEDLNVFLGGTATAKTNVKSLMPRKNYKNVLNDSDDAVMTVYLKATVRTVKDKGSAALKVPEWSYSTFYPELSSNDVVLSKFALDPSFPSGGYDHRLNPTGTQTFKLIDPKLNTPWFDTVAIMRNYATTNRYVSIGSYKHEFDETGESLLVKDNGTIFNTKQASWVNPFALLNSRVGVSNDATGETKETVTKNLGDVHYKIESPISSYGHTWKIDYPRSSCDEYGCYSWIETKSFSESLAPSYKDAIYKVETQFDHHTPDDNQATPKFDDTGDSTNGFYWETKQSDKTIKVLPEIAMSYDDANGNTSLGFAAGDKLRAVQPVAYNSVKYKLTASDPDSTPEVKPNVEGASVATDAKAKALAGRLSANGKSVIYRGSAINTSFATKGIVEFKTYALDIGNSALKNSWGNGAYSTDDINDEFMKAWGGVKLADGKWQEPFTVNGKLFINGKEEAGKQSIKKVTQKDRKVIEHTLVVRGGDLLSVDGVTDLDSIDPELKKALEEMKISNTSSNVFDNFSAKDGDILKNALTVSGSGAASGSPKNPSGSTYISLANLVRGVTNPKSQVPKQKLGEGWYNEDSTILVVREYIHTYDVPDYMYADKLPLSIDGLQAPIDKNQFFSKGFAGHTQLRINAGDDADNAFLFFNSSMTKPESIGQDAPSIEYVAPNVSITDTMQ